MISAAEPYGFIFEGMISVIPKSFPRPWPQCYDLGNMLVWKCATLREISSGCVPRDVGCRLRWE